jgi:hypothetical protein
MKTAIRIRTLLELDEKYRCPQSLGDAVGDSYLYGSNVPFRRLRDTAISIGYRFSSADSDLWRAYQFLPLVTLQRIIEGRVIPFADNRRVLEALVARDSEVLLPVNFLLHDLKGNRVMHESAHCVGVYLLSACESKQYDEAGNQEAVLDSILVEAFANTVEMLCVSKCRSVVDAICVGLNSYMKHDSHVQQKLASARLTVGEGALIEALFLGYVEANLSTASFNETVSERLCELMPPGLDTAALTDIFEVAFDLNRRFRENTTPLYYRLSRFYPHYVALRAGKWMERPGLRYRVQKASKIVEQYIEGPVSNAAVA